MPTGVYTRTKKARQAMREGQLKRDSSTQRNGRAGLYKNKPCAWCGKGVPIACKSRKYCNLKCAGKGWSKENTGRQLSPQHSKAISLGSKGKNKGALNGQWKGGAKIFARQFRRSRYYRNWRISVLERDSYKCVKCNSEENLEVDHIKPFAFFPELRIEISNGRTLCHNCHAQTDTYRGKIKGKFKQLNLQS